MNQKLTFSKPIIGLELHVELATESKMFCACPADHFAKKPNTQTCPVCLGLPGALPVPNQKALDWIIMLGLALGSEISEFSKFDRKHYFYPDLPKGYQISQYDLPICQGGSVDTSFGPVALTRAHMEEDTGKLSHKTLEGQKVSLVDFNRSGVPLVEIVTEPVIHSSAQAKEYAKNLTQIIRFLGISDADMEKGSMRLEANISWGLDLGYKVEVKNINSFNYLQKAIDFELNRQREILQKGDTPVQETRGYNETKGITFSQRTKEEAADYRYFPEPDIPPMVFSKSSVDAIRAQMPELPAAIKSRWQNDYQLKDQYYDVLLGARDLATYTDTALQLAAKAKLDPNQIAGAIVNKTIDPDTVSPEQLIQKLQAENNKVTDTSQLDAWAQQAIDDNPDAVTDYQAGKEASLQFLVGQVMKLSRGQASPPDVVKLLKNKLS